MSSFSSGQMRRLLMNGTICFFLPCGYSYGTRTPTCICYSYGSLLNMRNTQVWLFVRDPYLKYICYSYGIKFLLEIYMKFLRLLKFLSLNFHESVSVSSTIVQFLRKKSSVANSKRKENIDVVWFRTDPGA